MEIVFLNNALMKCANDSKLCRKKYGEIVASSFLWRLKVLRSIRTLEDARFLPGHYHELTGDRKGQWACRLDGRNRLIFTPVERPIPKDASGRYIWLEIRGIKIIGIEDYHER